MADGMFMARGEKGNTGPKGDAADITQTFPGLKYAGSFTVSGSGGSGFNYSGGLHNEIASPTNYAIGTKTGAIVKWTNIRITLTATRPGVGYRYGVCSITSANLYMRSDRYLYGTIFGNIGCSENGPTTVTVSGTSFHIKDAGGPIIALHCGEVRSGGDFSYSVTGNCQIWDYA